MLMKFNFGKGGIRTPQTPLDPPLWGGGGFFILKSKAQPQPKRKEGASVVLETQDLLL